MAFVKLTTLEKPKHIYVNTDHIAVIEDAGTRTIIRLSSGDKILVSEAFDRTAEIVHAGLYADIHNKLPPNFSTETGQ